METAEIKGVVSTITWCMDSVNLTEQQNQLSSSDQEDGTSLPVVLIGLGLDEEFAAHLLYRVEGTPVYVGVCSDDDQFFMTDESSIVFGMRSAKASVILISHTHISEPAPLLQYLIVDETLASGGRLARAHIMHSLDDNTILLRLPDYDSKCPMTGYKICRRDCKELFWNVKMNVNLRV